MSDLTKKAAAVKLIVFDVDGVLTNGSLFLGDNGEEYKAFHSRDGHGMKMLQTSGVDVAIITGRTSNVVTQRMKDLGIPHVYQGQEHKLPAFEKLTETLSVTAAEVAYVGDDVVDLPIMKRAGFAVAVADAHPLVREHAHWITPSCGGCGAAREICDLIMEAQGTLGEALRPYL